MKSPHHTRTLSASYTYPPHTTHPFHESTQVYEHQVAHLGPDAQQLCSTLKQMAHVCMRLRRFDDAEHYLEECLRIAIKWQGEVCICGWGCVVHVMCIETCQSYTHGIRQYRWKRVNYTCMCVMYSICIYSI